MQCDLVTYKYVFKWYNVVTISKELTAEKGGRENGYIIQSPDLYERI